MASPGKLRVAVLFGGRSAEHEISLLSARFVVEALDPERFEAVLVGIDKQGRWQLESRESLLAAGDGAQAIRLSAGLPQVSLAPRPPTTGAHALAVEAHAG